MDTRVYTAHLEEEQKTLEAELRSIGRPNPAVPGDWELLPVEAPTEPDPVDQAETVTNREENAAILADLKARYIEVTDALARAADGTYGSCAVCGKPIEEERLTADPAAATCIAHC